MKSNRAIDDWICVCLLLGNDFLPILPSIDTFEYSMDSLLLTYTSLMRGTNKHLTKNDIPNLERVKMFFRSIGEEEKSIFRNRHERDEQEGGHGSDLDDTIRLWEEGWHERYYTNKFNISQDNLKKFSIKVAQDSTRGLCWILQYYYQGVPSWDWYVFRIHLIISLFFVVYQVLSISLWSICF
jgi:5'-3' exoribonuclease 2